MSTNIITNLSELPKAIAQNNHAEIAKWIVKYQKFNFKTALKYAPTTVKEKTLRNYMTYGTKYIETGYQCPIYKYLFPYIQEQIDSCVQPLTPSLEDRKRDYSKNYTKKESVLPIAKLSILNKPLTAKVSYGIKFDDTIKLFESEEEARGFNKGIEYLKGEIGKLVTVELGEV